MEINIVVKDEGTSSYLKRIPLGMCSTRGIFFSAEKIPL
jgi:hypothetical protein